MLFLGVPHRYSQAVSSRHVFFCLRCNIQDRKGIIRKVVCRRGRGKRKNDVCVCELVRYVDESSCPGPGYWDYYGGSIVQQKTLKLLLCRWDENHLNLSSNYAGNGKSGGRQAGRSFQQYIFSPTTPHYCCPHTRNLLWSHVVLVIVMLTIIT